MSARETKETGVEVTPEMIEAGLKAYADWDSRVEERDGLVIGIFLAMLEALPENPTNPGILNISSVGHQVE